MLKYDTSIEIINCRGYGVFDSEYGYDYIRSLLMNPWVELGTEDITEPLEE